VLLFFVAIEIEWWRRVPLPPYTVGAVVVGVGAGLLWRARLPGRLWRTGSRHVVVTACGLVYFVPLVHWYTFMSKTGWHFLLNASGLLITMVWMLWTLNRLAGQIGLLVGDEFMAAESMLSGWLASGMALVPLVLSMVLGSYLAVQHESSLMAQIQAAQQRPGPWVPAFVLFPLSLTMFSLWKAKERCVRAVIHAPRLGSVPPVSGTTEGAASSRSG
jgi:hypothetical protein